MSALTNSEERELLSILGPSYGGPSISIGDGGDGDKDKFIIYHWRDAPVSCKAYCEGRNLRELLANYKKAKKKEAKK